MGFISNGTTILDNGAFSVGLGGLVLLSEQTASGSASISFTSGIDSTYPIYKFEFINIHPATDGAQFQMQWSTNGGSSYGVSTTNTTFQALIREDGSGVTFNYVTSQDVANSTSFFTLTTQGVDNSADSNQATILHLFNPSSTTYVKHFTATSQFVGNSSPNYTVNSFIGGYANTTSAIDAVQFKMSSGNIDAGTIKLYGIKDS